MNILIVAATEMEIAPFLQHLQAHFKQLGNDVFFNEKHKIQVLITGVGMVATTFSLTQALCEKSFDVVLQTGVAGSFDRNIPLGTVCMVGSELFGDLGAEDHYQYLDIFELGLEGQSNFPYINKQLVNNFTQIPFEINLPVVSALTINTVTGSETTAKARQKKYNCQLESMEGAAFHYVCLKMHIPFLQVRAISNYVEARDKSKWKMREAVGALNECMIMLLLS